MKRVYNILFLFYPVFLLAQNSKPIQSFTITYAQKSDGQVMPTKQILFQNNICFISNAEDPNQNFIDFNKNQILSILELQKIRYNTITPIDSLPIPKPGNKSEKILGYDCQYVSYNSFSNNIEVWFTTKTVAKGSPTKRFLPAKNALVLKYVVNGNYTLEATSIIENKALQNRNINLKNTVHTTDAILEQKRIESRFTKIPIFENEQINFVDKKNSLIRDSLKNNIVYHFSKGTVVLKKIKMPEDYQNNKPVFVDLNVASLGDAYDRTGSVFILADDQNKKSMLDAFLNGIDNIPAYIGKDSVKYQGAIAQLDFEPPVELMRFFTSFGAGYFNNLRPINGYEWARKAIYKRDVSNLIPANKEFWIGVYIGNYDKNGHQINLNLNLYPNEGDTTIYSPYVNPLFYMVNIMEMSGQSYGKLFRTEPLHVEFDISDTIKNLKLLFTTTGHGGWGGGDEFNPKLNTISLDGKKIFEIYPWRTDCENYRLLNPASGNFENGMSSSDFSRSNWCPGTLTLPFEIPIQGLSIGHHSLDVSIDLGKEEEGAFSHWNVSGVLVGDK